MKINEITLYNFGSYEGMTTFDTRTESDKNIIVFGGKNGAGKTTLFKAITICLYGCLSQGYKNNNSFYNRKITKLINNEAKKNKPANAYVELVINIPRGNNNNEYRIKRSWILDSGLKENYSVIKNGVVLDALGISDFENYIKSIIPPELFNLYFFDGEEIADFFLEEEGGKRIKDAFITLCGYDVFEIMKKNFKRLCTANKENSEQMEEYFAAQKKNEEAEERYKVLLAKKNELEMSSNDCDLKLDHIEKQYINAGGITEEERQHKLAELNEEEKKRAVWNQDIKRMANDTLPFIMIKYQLTALKNQIEKESKDSKFDAFRDIINDDSFGKYLSRIDSGNNIKDILNGFLKENESVREELILDLSSENKIKVLGQVNKYLNTSKNDILDIKRNIKESIDKGAALRKELEESNVSIAADYLKNKSELLELKTQILNDIRENEKNVALAENELDIATKEYEKAKKSIEKELKEKSIADISGKAILMLEKLNEVLYHNEIGKVEENFKNIINILMYKMNFIDTMHIDDDFTIHIYRYKNIPTGEITEMLRNRTVEEVESIIGTAAVDVIAKFAKSRDINDMIKTLEKVDSNIRLPIEIDKTLLSNGEKQIFIMALYYSLIMLGKQEIPFIIDTPFARIDMEHRTNISRHFFNKLSGQVFILSTDEEINSNHLKILKNKIAKTYLLENKDNNRTIVKSDNYFEV